MDKIKAVAAEVVKRSSPEAQVSWKVHSKSLLPEDLNEMSPQQLQMVYGDVQFHFDAEYRVTMLSKLLELHRTSENIKEAVDCLVQLRCPVRAVQFILD